MGTIEPLIQLVLVTLVPEKRG